MPSVKPKPKPRQPKSAIPDYEKPDRPTPARPTLTPAEYFEILARATNDAVWDWDLKSGALLWPRGLESLLGYAADASTKKIGFWFGRIHPEDLARIEQSLRETFASAHEHWSGEYRFRRADGEYINVLERMLITRNAERGATRAVSSMMDVSAWKQLQTEACRSQRMEAFGQLAGGVAHDFNNFLTTILGYSDLLLSEKAVKGGVARQVTEIRDAAERASALTNQLLAFSRRQALEPAVFAINPFILKLESTLLRLLGENISISCHLHQLKEGAHVRVDPEQLSQILLNLAVNARDAMRQGGQLTLTTAVVQVPAGGDPVCACADVPAGEYVAIFVSDNGSGMSDEVKARLFEPFFTTKEAQDRSGLGLASCYGIVRQSGGHICAESTLGEGTSMRIFLPRVPAPPAPSYRRRTPAGPPTGSETILVLEDDVSVRHLSVQALRRFGYDVIEAAGGDDAKRLLAERDQPQIDLLLTDLVMPEISGRNFANWLRQSSPQTKVVFVSGYLDDSLHPHDRRDPETGFLPKPFTAGQLAAKVREVLDEEV